MRVSGQTTLTSSDLARANASRLASEEENRSETEGGAASAGAGSATKARPTATPSSGEPATASEIERLTGNTDTEAYDPTVASIAIRDGVTYNRAVENANTTNTALGIPDRLEPVRSLPWETKEVNARVDELMAADGLSFDAAVVIAMTDRPGSKFESIFSMISESFAELRGTAPVEAGWEDQFATMVTGSSSEITAWAANQPASATATFGNTADTITVSMRDGMVVVSDGTTEQVFDPADHDRIVIAGGGGNDKITVEEDVLANLIIAGGTGNDTIIGGNGSNIIIGGSGDDNIEGGAGRDLIIGGTGDDVVYGGGGTDTIAGGSGRDSLYGGAGNDFVLGQGGQDYIDGGRGSDSLRGGTGDDVISGGFGRDKIRGEAGADTLIGASGTDLYADAEAGDTVIAESDETVEANGAVVRRVEVDNTAGQTSVSIDPASRGRFTDRVEDDLQTLRSLESGQGMLNGLDNEFATRGHSTQITELVDVENGGATASGPNRFLQADGTPGTGESTVITYNPGTNLDLNTSGATPPVAILFHEFAHAYHNATGQTTVGTFNAGNPGDPNFGTNLRELQAAGIAIDHDNDPTTPDQLPNPTGHPFELTENGLRRELGLEERTVY